MKVKKSLSAALFFVLVFSLFGCRTVITSGNIIDMQGIIKIEKGKTVYIVKVNDGTFGKKVYNESGKTVENYFSLYIGTEASKVIVGKSRENYEQEAKDLKADYIIKPTITHWEPRSAAWSGLPTNVEITVSVFDVKTGREIISKILSIRGRSWTFVSQSAEGLADSLIKSFCEEIF